MRLAIERAALLKALQHVSSVVERRVTIPILSNVFVAAGEGVLRLKATDLDIEVSETIAAATETPGETTVSAHMLHDIVRKLPDGTQVELALDDSGNHVNLSAGPARFALACLPATDYPDIASEDLTHNFTLPAGTLRKMIERTRFAISTEETRYYLNGIYFHTVSGDDGERLCAVATDGHRLAKTDAPLPDGAQGIPGVIIPRKTVTEVFKLLADRSAPVEIGLSSAKIRFVFDSGEDEPGPESVVLTSKLIDGTFPDYGRVIPTGNDKVMTVDCATFAAATDRVSTLSSEKGRAVKLNLAKNKLVLSVNNPDAGSAEEEIAVEYRSDALEIGFNARYLLDICAQIESDNAVFLLADASAPTLVKDAGDDAALYVLMPMRV